MKRKPDTIKDMKERDDIVDLLSLRGFGLSNKEILDFMKVSSDWRVEQFNKPTLHYVITAIDNKGNDIYIDNDFKLLRTTVKGRTLRTTHFDFSLPEVFKEFIKEGRRRELKNRKLIKN